MKNLIVVSMILVLTVVMGMIIRNTMFVRYLPEGFENEKDSDKKEADEKKDSNEKKESGEKKEAVKLDEKEVMAGFLKENGGNKELMDGISADTKAMIENQKALMDVMNSVKPALEEGVGFMKAFKGMMGNA